jgi:hypothetical protein
VFARARSPSRCRTPFGRPTQPRDGPGGPLRGVRDDRPRLQ